MQTKRKSITGHAKILNKFRDRFVVPVLKEIKLLPADLT